MEVLFALMAKMFEYDLEMQMWLNGCCFEMFCIFKEFHDILIWRPTAFKGDVAGNLKDMIIFKAR